MAREDWDTHVILDLTPEQQAALPDELKCQICFNYMKDPVSVCPSGHSFCRGCIKTLQNMRNTEDRCPVCRTDLMKPQDSLFLRRQAMDLLYCRCSSCEFRGKLQIVKYHVARCPNIPAPCKFKNRGCKTALKTEELKEHETTLCEFRDVRCTWCLACMRARTEAPHKLTCPKREEVCEFCKVSMKVEALAIHEHRCVKRERRCFFCLTPHTGNEHKGCLLEASLTPRVEMKAVFSRDVLAFGRSSEFMFFGGARLTLRISNWMNTPQCYDLEGNWARCNEIYPFRLLICGRGDMEGIRHVVDNPHHGRFRIPFMRHSPILKELKRFWIEVHALLMMKCEDPPAEPEHGSEVSGSDSDSD